MDIMNRFSEYQDYLAQTRERYAEGIKFVDMGIPQQITQLGFDFTSQLFRDYNIDRKEQFHNEFDFGKHEFTYLTNLPQIETKLKESIIMAIVDTDDAGRDITQKNLKRFLKNPHKSFGYTVAKGYYLYLGNHFKAPDGKDVEIIRDINLSWYHNKFPKIWDKRIQLDKDAFIKRLSVA